MCVHICMCVKYVCVCISVCMHLCVHVYASLCVMFTVQPLFCEVTPATPSQKVFIFLNSSSAPPLSSTPPSALAPSVPPPICACDSCSCLPWGLLPSGGWLLLS